MPDITKDYSHKIFLFSSLFILGMGLLLYFRADRNLGTRDSLEPIEPYNDVDEDDLVTTPLIKKNNNITTLGAPPKKKTQKINDDDLVLTKKELLFQIRTFKKRPGHQTQKRIDSEPHDWILVKGLK